MKKSSIHAYYAALGGKYVAPPKVDPPMYRGFMGFDNKTAGALQICKNPDTFNEIKSLTDRKGQSSILRKVTPNGGRLI